LNQRLISYARAHGCEAYQESGDDRVGVIVELPWYKPGTEQKGIDYVYVKTHADVRAALGY